ncbi:hypothetical protein B0T10DRAFT_404819 [Thelonectria olida]|uniref:Pyranose:oxygen 2-oxidoreductase n=1 Tax=Thelonectria olida TaxID=1576542 RepID=A0A9P8W4D1_9HYPO|nr:hypothetical protein B0T10DRAFT_404819 [Thelonectria olida]
MSPEAPLSGGSAKDAPVKEVDVLIVGSGPIGAVFARTLVEGGRKVLMVDIGEQETRRVGDHKKNSVAVQKDISLFTKTQELSYVLNGQNPHQKASENLPAAAASRVVGGMGSHWTCCTPRQHPDIERSKLFSDEKWDELYAELERMMDTNETSFDDSIRQQLVKHTLADAYENVNREMKSMPLACKRSEKNKDYVEWSCSATILGELADPKYNGGAFELRPNTQCIKLERRDVDGKIQGALLEDLMNARKYLVKANKYVICAGAVLTPGILYNSGFRRDTLPALGRYMTEQPMAFCQVVLSRKLVDSVEKDPYHLGWKKIVKEHRELHPNDPLPFPFNDPDPQCYFPLSEEYRWHTQIHRDAFGYGQVPAAIDQRVVVDLRWFGYVEPEETNCVEFTTDIKDEFGMPQPTFKFTMNRDDSDRCGAMITDMVEVARKLGGFLPGAEPKYLAPGSALHICGTYRAGDEKKENHKKESVVDRYGKVWGQDNLVLGGCGVIPTKQACNPTLTAGCFALAAARKMLEELKPRK